MITSRRRFLFGATAALVTAPAIVRVAANLMPIKPFRRETLYELMERRIRQAEEAMRGDLERAMDDLWNGPSHTTTPGFGLQALLADDMPVVGGLDRHSFEWRTASVMIYGRT